MIPDGSVLIRDGRIVSVGPTRRLENLKEARGALEVPVHGCIVMPGFVDSCIQLSLFGRSLSSPHPRRKRLADFYQDCVTLMRSCLQHGTLTAGIKACSGQSANDIAVLRQLARIGNNPVDMVRTWRPPGSSFAYPLLDTLAGTFATIRKHKLAGIVELRGDVELGAESPLLAAAGHADLAFSLNWIGGEAARLHRLLCATSPSGVCCCPILSPAECDVLAQSTAISIFNAGSQLLEDGPAGSVRDLVNLGGAIALSTGYDAEDQMNFNMQWVLALAVLRLHLSVEQAIVACTINGAHALRRGHEIGSIEAGKRAEILVLNLDDYRELPRRPGINHIGMVIRNGNIAINRTRSRVGVA